MCGGGGEGAEGGGGVNKSDRLRNSAIALMTSTRKPRSTMVKARFSIHVRSLCPSYSHFFEVIFFETCYTVLTGNAGSLGLTESQKEMCLIRDRM